MLTLWRWSTCLVVSAVRTRAPALRADIRCGLFGCAGLTFTAVVSSLLDYYVEAYVYGGNRALCNPVATSYRAFSEAWSWEGRATLTCCIYVLTITA